MKKVVITFKTEAIYQSFRSDVLLDLEEMPDEALDFTETDEELLIHIKEAPGFTDEVITALLDAWDYCDAENKSTEFMLTYMSDTSGVPYDDVVEWIASRESTMARAERWKGSPFGDQLAKKLKE